MELSRWRKAGVNLSGAILIALAMAACSDTPKPESEIGQGGRMSPATPGSARDFAVNVGDIVYFTTDSVDLSPEAQQTLANQARWLQQYSQYTITIEGHADERGTNEYNLALGERRAKATRDYLVSVGVDAGRITVISYGEERPTCTEKAEGCWAKNRRAHFLVKQ